MTAATWLTTGKFHASALRGKLRRVLSPKPWPEGGVLRLHLGCGAIDHPGFVNIDGIDRPHVHFVQSLTRLARFKDGSVDFVYSSHAAEHFPRDCTVDIFREWHRVLVPGGRLCISVPDFDRILEMYARSGQDMDAILPPLFGGQDYPFNFHFTAFNQQSLRQALLQAGFSSVQAWQPGSDAFHNLPDWSGRSIAVAGYALPISLNLEATK
ncbi:class I SAM-dependent methyltransferase [Rhodoferax sp.]|uniref:class I SAM-dependent methyltransferase n=1 Tax=Rhodoferax sp. TaxID=50421 RepID=UPI00374D7A7B